MKGIDNQDLHMGIDNQGPIKKQDLHTGIDNQGPIEQNQDLHMGIDNQGIQQNQPNLIPPAGNPSTGQNNAVVNQIQSTPVNPNKYALETSFTGCPQCGMSHPPIPQGETCPNASIEKITSENSNTPVKIKDQDFNKFLVSMKNILISQLDQIEVTNPQEIFKHLTLKVMEALEELKKK
jgi:hypothetical protein